MPWTLRRAIFLTAAKKLLFPPSTSGRAISIGMQELSACRPDILARDVAIARAMDLIEPATTLRVPTLILCGSRDRITPPTLSSELHGLIADSRLGVVDGAGHMLLIEAPDAVNREIQRFTEAVAHQRRRPTPSAAAGPDRAQSRWRRLLRRLGTLLRVVVRSRRAPGARGEPE